MISSTAVFAAAATSSGDSPARMRAWMSRGRSALSIFISNWPGRAFSPRIAARSLVSTETANSSPVELTSSSRLPSWLSPTGVRSCI